MSDITNGRIPPAALTGSMRDFRVPGGADLLRRTEVFFKWQDLRRKNSLWPFSRATEDGPGTVCQAQDDSGNKMRGVNFAAVVFHCGRPQTQNLCASLISRDRQKGNRLRSRNTRRGNRSARLTASRLASDRSRLLAARGNYFRLARDRCRRRAGLCHC